MEVNLTLSWEEEEEEDEEEDEEEESRPINQSIINVSFILHPSIFINNQT